MKGSLWDNIYDLVQFFIIIGVFFTADALNAAFGHKSVIILAIAIIWVFTIFLMTIYRFHRDSMQKRHERDNLIIKLEYDKYMNAQPDFSKVVPKNLSEAEREYAIAEYCKDAIFEKLMQDSREVNDNDTEGV